MIVLDRLTKSYPSPLGRRYVFRDLSVKFPERTNIGLIGRNGAGKSTLLRLLGGIDQPDHGSVITDKRISFPVALSGGFNVLLSGRENVEFVCRIQGYGGADMRAQVEFVRQFAKIGDHFDLPMRSYSSGMRSRLAFGLSMAFEFDYYLIDEVMAVGDPSFRAMARDTLLGRLEKANCILTSHNMSDIRQFCNVVLLVDHGKVKIFRDVEAGCAAYQAMARLS